MNKNLQLIWIICLFSSVFTVEAENFSTIADSTQIIERLITLSRDKKLSDSAAWLNLLHYKNSLFGAFKSQVDDTQFFMADNGAVNAQAELEATLRSFFQNKASMHSMCLFPARLYWLNSHLNFQQHLPTVNCQPYENWKGGFQSDQVTLLFPSMYLDNPASMFGHTLLRFDRKDKNQQLSKTLSYAAFYNEDDSFIYYSWQGVTGGYEGRFFLRPYADTLHTYSEIEQRDIWAYSLNLTQKEIDQLLRHLWEIKNTRFDYFFFRENCSYRLLTLLDVARENLSLSKSSHLLYAVPVDTVRDVENAGLISARYYLPSSDSKRNSATDDVDMIAPEKAHKTARWQLSVGELDARVFYEIGLRPVFHDLLDKPDGFIKGASVSVLETQFRWYENEERLKFEGLNVFSLSSIAPIKPWNTPLSKQLSFKILHRSINPDQRIIEFETQFSAGYAVEWGDVLMFAMAQAQLEYATQLTHNHGFYLGADMGAIWNIKTPYLSMQTELKVNSLQAISGEEGDIHKASLGVQFKLTSNHALRAEYELIKYTTFDEDEARLDYLYYF